MLRAAAWILEQESKMVRYALPKASPADRLLVQLVVGYSTVPIWGSVATMPYYGMARAQGISTWAVEDVLWTRSVRAAGGSTKFNTLTFWNYAPRTRAFASRGGARFVATKIASRFLGPIGVALLMFDAWHTGVWIGEQLFGEMEG